MWSAWANRSGRGRELIGWIVLTLGVGALQLPALGRMAAFDVDIVQFELMRTRPQPPTPNLLPGIQRRLRMQKRGAALQKRFGLGGIHPIALGLLMLALAGLAWLALELVQTSLR